LGAFFSKYKVLKGVWLAIVESSAILQSLMAEVPLVVPAVNLLTLSLMIGDYF